MRQNSYDRRRSTTTGVRLLGAAFFILHSSFFISACSPDEQVPAGNGGQHSQAKTAIALEVGITGESPATRTATRSVVTTDKTENPALPFAQGTSLYMVMKSQKSGGESTDVRYSRTIGYANEVTTTPPTAGSSDVTFATAYTRYWEDSYARSSLLSVYAACVPGYYLTASYAGTGTSNGTTASAMTIGGSAEYTNTWANTATTTITWPLNGASHDGQTTEFISQQDLCFSNNVSTATGGNGTMSFNDATKKFTAGRMVFYHALTRVTFKIKRGAGFGSGDGIFKFTNAATENIVMESFNTTGTFDIEQGEFTTVNTTKINKLCPMAAETGYDYVFSGLILPGTDLDGTDKNETGKVHFTIDGNTYHITKAQMKNALPATTDKDLAALDGTKMRAGVHYIFTMELGKKKIDRITAALVPWEQVEANTVTPSNARIRLSLSDHGEKKTGAADFAVYRAPNVYTPATGQPAVNDDWASYDWTTGYTTAGNKATLTETATAGEYTAKDDTDTDWYWPDNKTFYHFRAVSPTDAPVTTASGADNIALTAAESYSDVCWGAPFSSTVGKPAYSTDYGFDNTSGSTHQIYKAIGPTDDAINLVMFHIMSEVTILLTTSDGADKVTLTGATVSLSNIYPTGTAAMGTGLVTPTGTKTSLGGTVDGTTFKWTGGFVPQDLTGVQLTITTADNNQYIVDMKDILATVSENNITNPYTVSATSGRYTIGRWYPNYKYTYTFRLTKTAIDRLTATLAAWENVTADNQDVQIK